MVVAPVPTTAIVIATSGACSKNNIITNKSVFNDRKINDLNKVFATTKKIDAITKITRKIGKIISSSKGF